MTDANGMTELEIDLPPEQEAHLRKREELIREIICRVAAIAEYDADTVRTPVLEEDSGDG